MINKNQECDIVSDLLPLYMEQKTGKESNEFIRRHVEQCEECRKNLQFMEASYEELLEKENNSNQVSDLKRNKGICALTGTKRKYGHRKKRMMFKRAKGTIFVLGYLFFLLCIWLYMIFVLLR